MSKKTRRTQKGFSLVELLIAMMLLAVGVMATIAMQFVSLGGYTTSREVTGATEMARVVESRLRAEALGWTAATPVNTVPPVYADGRAMSYLAEIAQAGGTWVPLYATPVNQRLANQGSARFCVFAVGEQLVEATIPQPYMSVQIAVVYPGAQGTFPNQSGADLHGRCDVINTAWLVPGDPTLALEMQGLRASYFGTALRPQ
ncbi:hypothetical protein DL240_02320 [Lujinxingia litoralis]|uniref:Prepilin-type N-terminal cleavage/methylation domain-containing protein n=1 Tax=Lujinxingia litoralis TaxID=2211119 RepID=A0A328CBU5_9DELT|nr:prepilin-type N-terminal cleavage/methylation domain-containing protein [Lujinxingia litoralis]RAL25070.1 hypothetical protein DL240_02320 [Lujinxingia litoralis]